MLIESWNVNGIRAVVNKGAFASYIESAGPDIILLQETKAREEDLPPEVANPSGYYAEWVSAQKKGYSGVAILTKEKPDAIFKGFGNPKFDDEGRTIIAQFGNTFVVNCYFPNGKRDEDRLQYKLDFYEAIFSYTNALIEQGHQVIIAGDYNTAHTAIDLARPKDNEDVSGFLPIERAWIDKIVDMGYQDTFRLFNQDPDHYTWWSFRAGARRRNVGWRIDYVFASEGLRSALNNAYIRPDQLGSDHCPVGIDIDL